MAKKSIGKILTSGSLRKRALLVAEEIARDKLSEKRLLTDSEYDQLLGSFKKPNEMRLLREFKDLDSTITNAIHNMEGLKFEVLRNYSNLRGYILVWNAVENAELLVNSVLHEIKDAEERKRIAETGARGINILLSKIVPDQEGYINIDIHDRSKKLSFSEVMNNVKIETDTSVVKFLSWEKAILDFMDERGFDVKTYKNHIGEMRALIESPIIGLVKYSGEIDTGISQPRLEELMNKYALCPDIEDMEIDKDQYDFFMSYVLTGEDLRAEDKTKSKTR